MTEIPENVQAVIEDALDLRATGTGGPCPHCAKPQDRHKGKRYSSGSHSAAVEAAFIGYVLCCGVCEKPLGRMQGFMCCPTHGWDCGGPDRKKYPLPATPAQASLAKVPS